MFSWLFPSNKRRYLPIEVFPRRGMASEWTSANPVLKNKELALEADTRKIKIGDGTTPWLDLPYESELLPIRLCPSFFIYKTYF